MPGITFLPGPGDQGYFGKPSGSFESAMKSVSYMAEMQKQLQGMELENQLKGGQVQMQALNNKLLDLRLGYEPQLLTAQLGQEQAKTQVLQNQASGLDLENQQKQADAPYFSQEAELKNQLSLGKVQEQSAQTGLLGAQTGEINSQNRYRESQVGLVDAQTKKVVLDTEKYQEAIKGAPTAIKGMLRLLGYNDSRFIDQMANGTLGQSAIDSMQALSHGIAAAGVQSNKLDDSKDKLQEQSRLIGLRNIMEGMQKAGSDKVGLLGAGMAIAKTPEERTALQSLANGTTPSIQKLVDAKVSGMGDDEITLLAAKTLGVTKPDDPTMTTDGKSISSWAKEHKDSITKMVDSLVAVQNQKKQSLTTTTPPAASTSPPPMQSSLNAGRKAQDGNVYPSFGSLEEAKKNGLQAGDIYYNSNLGTFKKISE